MRIIYKYKLKTIDIQTINLPEGAKILTVQTQNGEPCLWAEVESDNPSSPRTIATHGTGHTIPKETGRYIATYKMAGDSLVFHVFEQIDSIEKSQ